MVNKFLTPVQHEFRQYRSTTDVLTNIEANICDALLKMEYLRK